MSLLQSCLNSFSHYVQPSVSHYMQATSAYCLPKPFNSLFQPEPPPPAHTQQDIDQYYLGQPLNMQTTIAYHTDSLARLEQTCLRAQHAKDQATAKNYGNAALLGATLLLSLQCLVMVNTIYLIVAVAVFVVLVNVFMGRLLTEVLASRATLEAATSHYNEQMGAKNMVAQQLAFYQAHHSRATQSPPVPPMPASMENFYSAPSTPGGAAAASAQPPELGHSSQNLPGTFPWAAGYAT